MRFTRLPNVAEGIELEPNDRKAQPVPIPSSIRGFLHTPEDTDVFLLGVDPSQLHADAGHLDVPATRDVEVAPQARDQGSDAMADADRGADGGPANLWEELPQKDVASPTIRVEFEPAREGIRAGLTWSAPDGETRYDPDDRGRVSICGRSFRPGEVELAVRPLEVKSDVVQKPGIDYRLSITEDGGGGVFEVEPNDSRATADRLETGRKAYLAESSDVDFWGLVVEPEEGLASDRLRVAIDADRRASFDARLLDSDGGLVAVMPDRSGTRQLEVDLPRGVYYVEVRAKSGGGCASYSILAETGF